MGENAKKATLACEACRVRKRKCDGNSPCSYCIFKQQPCNFPEGKKRGPKKRKIEEVNNSLSFAPAAKSYEMSEIGEAFHYLETCGRHVHRIKMLSSMENIRNPVTPAHKVQAYASFALTARMCGNKSKSQVYMDQARILAGQIFDSAEVDAVVGMLFMSFCSMLNFDLSRTSFYSNVGASLCKMIAEDKMSNKLSAICQLTTIMSDNTITTNQQARLFRQLINSITHASKTNQDRLICNKVSLMAELVQVFDHRVYYEPSRTTNIFEALDNLVVREETRLHIFDIMNNLLISEANEIGNCTSYLGKICIPVNKAILNWKSGHLVEAMENALSCFLALQTIEDECLYDLLLHSPELYLLSTLVKLFLDQGQISLAQKMAMQVTKICSRMKPDLDNICREVEKLLQTHFMTSSHNYSTKPPENILLPSSFFTSSTFTSPPYTSSYPISPSSPPSSSSSSSSSFSSSSSSLSLVPASPPSPLGAKNKSPENPSNNSSPVFSSSPSPLPSPENNSPPLPFSSLLPLSLPRSSPLPLSISVQWKQEEDTPKNISPTNLPPLFLTPSDIFLNAENTSPENTRAPLPYPSFPSFHPSPSPSPSSFPFLFPSSPSDNWRVEDIERILGLN